MRDVSSLERRRFSWSLLMLCQRSKKQGKESKKRNCYSRKKTDLIIIFLLRRLCCYFFSLDFETTRAFIHSVSFRSERREGERLCGLIHPTVNLGTGRNEMRAFKYRMSSSTSRLFSRSPSRLPRSGKLNFNAEKNESQIYAVFFSLGSFLCVRCCLFTNVYAFMATVITLPTSEKVFSNFWQINTSE